VRHAAVLIAILVLAVAVTACGGGDIVEGPAPAAPDEIQLTSSAFEDGASIPRRFSCDGEDVSPPLAWSGVPGEARSLALLVEDPDAPGGTFVHWTVFGVPADTTGMDEGQVPDDAREGENSFGDSGYGGPCPPAGDEPHRYVFTVYALRSEPGLDAGASPEEVRDAVADAAIARGQLTGRFGR
jgi:Raf kinase inhibitor-like YbhB/YbcL family protein